MHARSRRIRRTYGAGRDRSKPWTWTSCRSRHVLRGELSLFGPGHGRRRWCANRSRVGSTTGTKCSRAGPGGRRARRYVPSVHGRGADEYVELLVGCLSSSGDLHDPRRNGDVLARGEGLRYGARARFLNARPFGLFRVAELLGDASGGSPSPTPPQPPPIRSFEQPRCESSRMPLVSLGGDTPAPMVGLLATPLKAGGLACSLMSGTSGSRRSRGSTSRRPPSTSTRSTRSSRTRAVLSSASSP